MTLPNGYRDLFIASFGDSVWEEYLAALQRPHTRGLRINPLRTGTERLRSEDAIPWASDAYSLDLNSTIGNDPLHAAGCLYLQEPTAMAPVTALAPLPGERILDLCAAPGGKTTQIGTLMQGTGFLLANDPHPARAEALAENVERFGLPHAAVANVEPERLIDAYHEHFDGILVDAPCSGEGLFRRDPGAVGQWSEAQVERNAVRQLTILDAAYRMLRPGGRLVYSTCTFNPLENELVCAAFARAHLDMTVEPVRLPGSEPGLSGAQLAAAGTRHPLIGRASDALTAWGQADTGGTQVGEQADAGGTQVGEQAVPTELTARFFPQHANGEGHFIARFHKRAPRATPALKRTKTGHKAAGRDRARTDPTEQLAKEFADFARRTLRPEAVEALLSDRTLRTQGTILYAVAAEALRVPALLRPGLALMRRERGHAAPHHALALALRSSDAHTVLRLPYGDPRILSYLRGETIPSSTRDGWTLVAVDEAPLGWGKTVNGTLKNHYPKGLRRAYAFALEI